jgi:hypothetical protein
MNEASPILLPLPKTQNIFLIYAELDDTVDEQ